MIGKRARRGLALGAATFVVVGGIAATAARPALAAAGSLDPAFGDGGIALSTATAGNIAALGLDAAGDIFVLSNEGSTKGNLGALPLQAARLRARLSPRAA